jgi:uncharacterized membrane protein HdeD (DUF308 family)
MGLSCNIDAKGKRARLIWGILTLVCGVSLMLTWARASGSILAWIVSIVLVVAGAFSIWEARAGWCAMRAMGFKTPM